MSSRHVTSPGFVIPNTPMHVSAETLAEILCPLGCGAACGSNDITKLKELESRSLEFCKRLDTAAWTVRDTLHFGHEDGSEGDEQASICSFVLFHLLRSVHLQPHDINTDAVPTIAYLYTTCLLVVGESSGWRYALGRDVSPPIAALTHAASLMALVHIFVWPDNKGDSNGQRDMYRTYFQPGEQIGLSVLISMQARTTQTRALENAVPVWLPCKDTGSCTEHNFCGYVLGQHYSASLIGETAEKLQKDLFDEMIGLDGIFSLSEIHASFFDMLSRVVDDPNDRTRNHCFIDNPQNLPVKQLSDGIVRSWLDRVNGLEHLTKLQKAKATLEQIRRISWKLTTLLYMTGGSCGRGTEQAEFSVRNTNNNPLRSFFFMQGMMVAIPTHTKLTWNETLTLHAVSRHPPRYAVNFSKRLYPCLSRSGQFSARCCTSLTTGNFHRRTVSSQIFWLISSYAHPKIRRRYLHRCLERSFDSDYRLAYDTFVRRARGFWRSFPELILM